MRESYVPPVTAAREPKPDWQATWRFRVVSFVLLAILAVATVKSIDWMLHRGEAQDPGTTPATSGP